MSLAWLALMVAPLLAVVRLAVVPGRAAWTTAKRRTATTAGAA